MSKRTKPTMATESPTAARGARALRGGRKPASAPASSKTKAARRRPGSATKAKPTPAERRAAARAISADIDAVGDPHFEPAKPAKSTSPRFHDTRELVKAEPKAKGGAWPAREALPESKLGPVALATLQTVRTLTAELGRKPSATQLAHRLGLSPAAVNEVLTELGDAGLAKPLAVSDTGKRCLQAIIALEARLGGSPSTREVSAEMGLSPSASRYHIRKLLAVGLVTPPEVRLVLTVTPAGRALAT